MAQEVHPLVLLYKDETYQFEVPSSWTMRQLHEFLEEQLDVSQMTQKLLLKLESNSSKLIKFGDQNMEKPLVSALPRLSRLLLVGSTQEEVTQAQALKGDKLLLGFDEELKRSRAMQSYNFEDSIKNTYLQPRFGGVESLQQFHNPPPSHALALLRRLANDPGIVGIMEKHNWSVGMLKEMPPEGLVGVDQVCVLGYNQNKGESIVLRLRTDNLKGFRKYLVIRDTLLHELCHNDFSEHDARFWKLFYQLKREVVELDTSTRGQIVGGRTYSEMAQFDYSGENDDSMDVYGHILDPEHQHAHHHHGKSASHLALEAAERRLAAATSVETQSSVSTYTEPKPLIQEAPTTKQISNSPIVTNDPPSSSFKSPSIEKAPNTQLESPSDERMLVDERPSGNFASAADAPPTVWRCKYCTLENDLSAKSCLACGAVSDTFQAQLDAAELGEAQTVADPQLELNRNIQKSLNEFVNPLQRQDRLNALQTLLKIYSNILSNPAEPKFKSISLTSKTFLNNIGRHFGALEHLNFVGFGPDPSNKDLLRLVRDDVVRMYLASSAVQAKLAAETQQ